MSPEDEVERAEREADAVRGHLDGLLGELDRRRRNALDVRRQARQHPMASVVVGVAVFSIVAGLSAMAVRRIRKNRMEARVDRLRQAWSIAREALLATGRR